MRQMMIVVASVAALSACTTAERTATGAAVGGAVGGLATGSAGGVAAGAVIAGLGTYLYQTRDGQCRYRKSNGTIVTRKCHWR